MSINSSLGLEMVKLRYWQHLINEDLKKKVFNIPIHVAFGCEAIAAAVSNMMKTTDQLSLTHRNIAYNLARAGDLKPVYQEYRLSSDGLAGGKLGSMNLTNPKCGIVYSSSILGNNLSVGCGLALAKQVKKDPGIVIVTTGDGAMEEGGFYETLVFAKSHNLKLMIIVENNNHSMSSTIEQRRCRISIQKICEAISLVYKPLQGNNVFQYAVEINELRRAIDEESVPVCIEVTLNLLNQHAGPTPGWDTDPMSVDLKEGLVIENSVKDPLFVLRETVGEKEFERMAVRISQEWCN